MYVSHRVYCSCTQDLVDSGLSSTDIKEGKIVPVEITVKLLKNAMQKSEIKKFLVDGFPRSVDNYEVVCDIILQSTHLSRTSQFSQPMTGLGSCGWRFSGRRLLPFLR